MANEDFKEGNGGAGHRCDQLSGTLCKIRKCDFATIMAKSKRKSSKFTAAREARRRAREMAGPPPAQRVIPDKRLKPSKHKKNLLEDSGE
jgi:hypothetical protein